MADGCFHLHPSSLLIHHEKGRGPLGTLRPFLPMWEPLPRGDRLLSALRNWALDVERWKFTPFPRLRHRLANRLAPRTLIVRPARSHAHPHLAAGNEIVVETA